MYPQFSLTMNSKLVQDGQPRKYGNIRISSRTVLFLDGGLPNEKKVHPAQADYDGRPHVYANRAAFRHSGRVNLLMADGHVEARPASDVFDPNSRPNPGGAFYPQHEVVWTADPLQNPN